MTTVKTFPSNGYSLYDMAGNVWEWCSDGMIIIIINHYKAKQLPIPKALQKAMTRLNLMHKKKSSWRQLFMQRQLLQRLQGCKKNEEQPRYRIGAYRF